MQFLFRLCLAIGGNKCLHPDTLAKHLLPRQISEWMAYARLFPFGDERADYRSALSTYHIRAALVEDEDSEPNDFMPKFDNAAPKSEAEMILDKIRESL